MERSPLPAVGPPVVQRVLLCDVYRREQAGYRAVASSLPGHLIQLTITGRTTHEANGRRYELKPGHLIWYHENEQVRIHVHEAPWSFYTLNFIAPGLSPPRFEERVRRVGKAVYTRFDAMLKVWRDTAVPPGVRELRVQSAILALLAQVLSQGSTEPFAMNPSAQLWWDLETQLRRELDKLTSLKQMSELTGRSAATIARSCRQAVGVAPMKRIKQVRMSLAAGLVQRSDLRMTEIADRIGYSRVHEFSRDYRKHFGIAPTDDRERHT